MRRSPSLCGFAAGTLLLAVACTDQNEPAAPSDQPELLPPSLRQGPADNPNALARSVPGFGGFFYDAQGLPTMYLKRAAERGNAERALGPYLQARGLAASGIRVRPGDFSWAELEGWQAQATSEALAVPGAVFVDADEASNKVRIGVERGGGGRIHAALRGLGLPASAVIVQETEPVTFAVAPKPKPGGGQNLQGLVRPIIGGVQINFPGFLCTLGFNATATSDGGESSFITNSHCTNIQGGVQSTPYRQPLQSVDPTIIGVEVEDPTYFTGGQCPTGRRCRFSDASRARYNSGVPFTRGRIAKTNQPRRNSLAIVGNFSITGEGSAVVGQTVNKVGRTTGWSQGPVTGVCVNANVAGTDITQFCQTNVSATVGSGDSGSPVFAIGSGDNVTLLGILWGGSGSSSFVFSPINQVEQELGALTTTP
jgi:hypothetical protein